MPDYVGGGRPVRPDPFRNEAPGFFDHLREERGLRESSIKHYRHYLNRFAAFLARHRIASLGELSVATGAAPHVLHANDLDNDGRPDLVVAHQGETMLGIFVMEPELAAAESVIEELTGFPPGHQNGGRNG